MGGKPFHWSALSLCCNRDPHNERFAIAQVLVNKRANLEVRNDSGATPLITACASGFQPVVRLLLDAKADAKATSDRGMNALDIQQALGASNRQVF